MTNESPIYESPVGVGVGPYPVIPTPTTPQHLRELAELLNTAPTSSSDRSLRVVWLLALAHELDDSDLPDLAESAHNAAHELISELISSMTGGDQ